MPGNTLKTPTRGLEEATGSSARGHRGVGSVERRRLPGGEARVRGPRDSVLLCSQTEPRSPSCQGLSPAGRWERARRGGGLGRAGGQERRGDRKPPPPWGQSLAGVTGNRSPLQVGAAAGLQPAAGSSAGPGQADFCILQEKPEGA